MADKLDRKQLRQPDEFQQKAGQAMEWMIRNQRTLLGGLAALVALALVIWGVTYWRGSREESAGAALAEAIEVGNRPIAGEAAPNAGEQTFASRDEREKAVLAALEKVRAEHGGTTAAETALAEIGFHKLKAGDAAGAQKDLQDFLDKNKDHALRAFAIEALGYAQEAQGKLDDARATFEKLRDAGAPARADFQAGRLALAQGKPDGKQKLEQVAKEYAKDPVAQEANERVELAGIPPLKPGEPASSGPPAAPEKAPAAAPAPAEKKPAAKKPVAQGKKQ